MLCAYPVEVTRPFVPKGVVLVPCGRCMCCRINRRRAWACRILLEQTSHPISTFVTLTYAEENVPWADVGGIPQMILIHAHLRDFMKRWRNNQGKFRYFACGEYGEKHQRPHFHLVMFGVDPGMEKLIEETWGAGFVTATELISERAHYVASYTVKKWTNKDNDDLGGRPPEFAVMSRKPAIGTAFIDEMINSYMTRKGSSSLMAGNVSRSVRLESGVYPLDRTMTEKLREGLGLPKSFQFIENTKPAYEPEDIKKAQVKDSRLRDRARHHAERAAL